MGTHLQTAIIGHATISIDIPPFWRHTPLRRWPLECPRLLERARDLSGECAVNAMHTGRVCNVVQTKLSSHTRR